MKLLRMTATFGRLDHETLTLTDGLWLGEGDITVSGGEIVIPGGPDALCADNGSVTVTGGTVREP